MLFFRDRGPTEIGGFGIAGEDPFCVEDIGLVQQLCTSVTVQFADDAVADFFDAQVDLGRRPEQFGRIWVHTHPGDSAEPSGTDEETFARCFGRADWAVMFILARGGQTYSRLRFNVGPGGTLLIPAEVDYGVSFPAADREAWERDYLAQVVPVQCLTWETDRVDARDKPAVDDRWSSPDGPFEPRDEFCFEPIAW